MSQKLTPIPDNVWAFINRASADIARMEGERFKSLMHCEIVEAQMASPIEQLFIVALHTFARAECIAINPEPEMRNGSFEAGMGVQVWSQRKIGKFRVDFSITRNWRELGDFGQAGIERSTTVIVELDGHQFHDRDKHQRSYEKARDRFLQREGFKVLHYTGSDVVADPYRVAHEVLSTLGAFSDECAYDESNPFGLD